MKRNRWRTDCIFFFPNGAVILSKIVILTASVRRPVFIYIYIYASAPSISLGHPSVMIFFLCEAAILPLTPRWSKGTSTLWPSTDGSGSSQRQPPRRWPRRWPPGTQSMGPTASTWTLRSVYSWATLPGRIYIIIAGLFFGGFKGIFYK